jgi:hypothetical protein
MTPGADDTTAPRAESQLNGSAAGVTQAQATAVENIQSTTKWLIAAIGAVAFAVLAGVQLSAIGRLHGHQFDVALIWASIAILGVLIALAAAAQVLIPRPITLGAILQGGTRFGNLQKRLEKQPALRGLALAGLANDRTSVAAQFQKSLDDLLDDLINNKGNADVLGPRLAQLNGALAREDATVEAVEWLARYHSTKIRFRVTLVGISLGIVLVLIGTLGFLSKTAGTRTPSVAVACPNTSTASVVSTAATDSSPCPQGAPITAGQRVIIRLDPAGISEYQARFPGCVLHVPPNLVGTAVGGTWMDPMLIVTLANNSAQPPCVTQNSFFQLNPSYGSIIQLGN